MSKLRAPAISSADARRFAYCVLLAAAFHALGALTPRSRVHRTRPEEVVPLRTVVPVSLDETPVPVALEPAPLPAAAPPPPPPPAPPPAAPVAAAPESLSSRSAAPAQQQSHHASTATPRPRRPQRETRNRTEKGLPFSGEHGAFEAKVCLLPRNVRSALAVNGCTPVAQFRSNALDVPPRRFTEGFPGVTQRVDFFGIDYGGRFKVRASGYYTFRLLADDGALLYIDGALVLDNDGQHSAVSKHMSLPLSAGEHEFRVLYYQGPPDELALQLFVKSYKSEERLFGPEL